MSQNKQVAAPLYLFLAVIFAAGSVLFFTIHPALTCLLGIAPSFLFFAEAQRQQKALNKNQLRLQQQEIDERRHQELLAAIREGKQPPE